MPREFVDEILTTAKRFPWIKDIEPKIEGKIARVRLRLKDDFVDAYYNAETQTTSYAYIEKRKRIFGANNIRINWHLHPFGKKQKHKIVRSMNIRKFLQMLESELRNRKKLQKAINDN